MIRWIRQNPWEAIVLFLIITVAAFFRFYQLPEYMTFLGDEGRDALIIRNILVNRDFPLLGPPTSVGNIYLGPLYYYMMAVPMAIFWLNPVSAAFMIAVIGILTVLLVYYLARSWFGFSPAILSAFLYAVSPVTIIYSRSSWNPNPAPLFSLLAILGFYKAHQSRNFLWLGISGLALAFALQMHYLALILLPFFAILWIYELTLKTKDRKIKHFYKGTFLSVLTFLFLMSPLLIFDLKYNFMNYRAISALFTAKESSVAFNLLDSFGRIFPIYQEKLIGRYLSGGNTFISLVISLLVILPLILAWLKSRASSLKNSWAYFTLGLWLVVGLIGLSFYRQEVYDHYLGFLNPVPYLLFGGLVGFLKGRRQYLFMVVVLIVLGTVNLLKNPLLSPPNNQLTRTQEIAKFVINETANKPFNFALIAKNNYDAAYQFYLEQYGFKSKVVPLEITGQLFVVCEDPVCQPVGHAKYEIAGFGWTKIAFEKEIEGVKVFKLIHHEQDPNY